MSVLPGPEVDLLQDGLCCRCFQEPDGAETRWKPATESGNF
jgi:hypothetical protein